MMATDSQTTLVTNPRSIVMMGATGAVGGEAMRALQTMPSLARLTLLTRRLLPEPLGKATTQHAIDVFSSASYVQWMADHDVAICTLGVGQPSKMSDAEFIRIDKEAVIEFAGACQRAGVKHFELLASVGISSTSRSLYLRTKGELKDALIAMNFERLSVFQPSVILTPTNRYGVTQALALALWPTLNPLLRGGWKKYRGIEVATLGKAIACNVFTEGRGVESLHWPEIKAIADATALR
jgi:uncharacterized protein YbjT (DUF2867 family)